MNDLARNQIRDELMPRRFGKLGKLWTIVLIMIVLLGSYFYVQQIRNGLGVTGLGNYHTWGVYISNFVFFVAISLVGSLISAILKLSNVKWQTPLTRISEMIAVAAIIFAAIVIIIDMGRPDRFMNVVLKARIQSPITWDVIVISTYFVISIILLYLPLVPDLALMRDKGTKERPWVQKMYRLLAINWKGSDEQKKILNSSIRVLSILIIPVAFGIHTVTSWLFATTFRPGWDSTNFGPYFVSGAFMVGAAAVICAMYLVRRQYGLEKYFSNDLFNKMGRLLVLLSLVYFYFNINEYLTPAYKMKAKEMGHLQALFTGEYATMFWSTQVLGMLVPIIVLVFRRGRRPVPMFIISIMVIVGAWFKRFLIVVPTLSHPLITTEMLPDSALHYVPTFAELSITAATLAGALLILTILIRYFPVVPIVETLEEKES